MISKAGYFLFVVGIIIFLSSFFMSSYTVSQEVLQENLGESAAYFEAGDGRIAVNTYSSSFALSLELDDELQRVNSHLIDLFGISSSEMSVIIEGQGEVFVLENALETISSFPNGEYKAGAFRDFGSWLDGRSYSSEESMAGDLETVISNIERYAIISQKGFDKYRIKQLKYDIVRDSSSGFIRSNSWLMIILTYGFCVIGAVMIYLPRIKRAKPGIKNNGIFFNKMKARGWLGVLTGTLLILFYILLYFYPEHMTNWIIMVDPISAMLNGGEAGQFFLYGFLYTLAVLVMGVRMMINYRHSKYQLLRTASVMFFQLAFAFLIPEILVRLNQPYFDFKNIWPLDYDFFFDSSLNTLIQSGSLGIFMLGWGIALIILGVPVFTYIFGKRWYCSWVCGCGGLAETLGDPYRQLSDKSLKAWKAERIIIHSVLVFAVVMTVAVLYTYWTGNSEILGFSSYSIRETYGAWIGAGFAGVVGTGFYPFMGNRVWCRFGCPLAAYLGIIQRFKSRFRITTNGGQCISCGNCSTYCEMGIDVRWYAQRGQNIVRSSCVGCGICSSVCPRGVLNLEVKSEEGRFGLAELPGNDSFNKQS